MTDLGIIFVVLAAGVVCWIVDDLCAGHPIKLKKDVKKRRVGLTHAEQFAHLACVGTVHETCVLEIALLLFGLLGQNVTVESVVSFDLTRSGKVKPFFGTGISLYFWHFLLFL